MGLVAPFNRWVRRSKYYCIVQQRGAGLAGSITSRSRRLLPFAFRDLLDIASRRIAVLSSAIRWCMDFSNRTDSRHRAFTDLFGRGWTSVFFQRPVPFTGRSADRTELH